MARFANSSVFDWLDRVRARPGMYGVGEGGNLAVLEWMVWGYYSALRSNGVVERVPEMTRHFLHWLWETKRWSVSCGWTQAITEHARRRPPLDVFFELVDRYRTLRPTLAAVARLHRRHVPTGHRLLIRVQERLERPSRVEIVRYHPTRLYFPRYIYASRTDNGELFYRPNGSHQTSLAFAKRACAVELQTAPADWHLG